MSGYDRRRKQHKKTYNKRVTLSSENRDGVDDQRLCVHAVGLDDVQGMVVNAEGVIRIAREGH